jgi:hypothetical protein
MIAVELVGDVLQVDPFRSQAKRRLLLSLRQAGTTHDNLLIDQLIVVDSQDRCADSLNSPPAIDLLDCGRGQRVSSAFGGEHPSAKPFLQVRRVARQGPSLPIHCVPIPTDDLLYLGKFECVATCSN